jgi:hypothetical protein
MNGFHQEDCDSMQRFVRRENLIHFGQLLTIETDKAKRQVLVKLLTEEHEKQREAGDLTPRSRFLCGAASADPPCLDLTQS